MLQGQILRFVYNYISTSLPYIKILLILSHNCFKYSGTSPYGHLNPEISPGGVQNEKNRKFPNFART